MKVLLDTHVLLWWMRDDARLGKRARSLIEDPENQILVSAATIWEIAIKKGRGLIEIDVEKLIAEMDASGLDLVPIHAAEASRLETLPEHHRDPFDRMLICQAIAAGAVLLTADDRLFLYQALDGLALVRV
ncbi:MAG TPA: type II toxin-antitoxin system VapC family toxin [Thermoanaerobaculia bacterium]|nr:type II toxin-antitoxin system VapC family toxin [Thermoanaerobaculia bacterium]